MYQVLLIVFCPDNMDDNLNYQFREAPSRDDLIQCLREEARVSRERVHRFHVLIDNLKELPKPLTWGEPITTFVRGWQGKGREIGSVTIGEDWY